MLFRSSSIAVIAALSCFGCMTPELAKKDMLRDARVGCDRGNAAACYHAGVLYAESGDKEHAEAANIKGCALKQPESCDALASVSAPRREAVFADACGGGDLPTCSRLADTYAADPVGTPKAKSLLEQVCRAASAVSPDTRSRDLQGAALACSKLAALHLRPGADGRTDAILALRLEALSTMLFTEALFRLEKQQDAALEREIATRPATPAEKDRQERASEASQKSHEAFLQILDSKVKATGDGDGSMRTSPLTILDEVFGNTALLAMPRSEPPADDATHCKDTGDAVSCALAAAQVEKTDPAAALALHTAGCTKRPDQCWSLIAYAESALRKKDVPRATQILEKGCELKSPSACIRLALEAEQGERGIPQDLSKAARLLDKGCEAGSARACLMLATLVDDGRGAGKNPARAKQLHAKADGLDNPTRKAGPAMSASELAADEQSCRQGRVAEKCNTAGAAVQDTDAVKAEELYRLGCTTNKQSCSALWGFAVDRFRKDDTSRASRILEQGCQENAATACLILAEVQHLGYRSAPRAEARAAELYQRGCDFGDAFSCRVTASRFRAVKNTAKADELHEKGQKVDEEAERTRGDGDRWARDAAELRAVGPHAQELAKALADWRALTEKARARAQARTKRLEAAYSGHRLTAIPPFAKEDVDASGAREASVRRMVSALFLAPPHK